MKKKKEKKIKQIFNTSNYIQVKHTDLLHCTNIIQTEAITTIAKERHLWCSFQ